MADSLLTKYGTRRNGHAIFSPSGSYGWLNCPGYLLANAVAEDSAGYDAAYGTVAHEVAQQWLTFGEKPEPGRIAKATAGGRTFEIAVDEEMIGHVERYVEWCEEVTSEGDVYVERWVDTSRWMPIPEQGGTADFFVCKMGKLIITDLKMGIGVPVHVENNPQAMIYALGVFDEWDFIYHFEEIVIRICQPRLDYFGVWTCTRDQLLSFGEYVRYRALLAWQENAPRIPGKKQCRFCAVQTHCPAVSMHLDSLADETFEFEETTEGPASYDPNDTEQHIKAVVRAGEPALPEPKALPTWFLAYRLAFRKLYDAWFHAIYEELNERAQRGEKIPGFKEAEGRKSYEWKDEEEARKLLLAAGLDEEDAVHSEVISVSLARKSLKLHLKMKGKEIEKLLEPVIDVRPGKRALVPVDDPRADFEDYIDGVFAQEDEDL